MDLNVEKELAALRRMTIGELRDKYAEAYREPTNARHRDWLIKRIIWRMQANAEGDLSERAKRRAAELANDADLRTTAPKTLPIAAPSRTRTTEVTFTSNRLPIPGTVLTRDYKGQSLRVTILDAGFAYEGEAYKSLSAVAKHITESHCNGYLCFRLTGGK